MARREMFDGVEFGGNYRRTVNELGKDDITREIARMAGNFGERRMSMPNRHEEWNSPPVVRSSTGDKQRGSDRRAAEYLFGRLPLAGQLGRRAASAVGRV